VHCYGELNRRVSLELCRNQQIGHSYLMATGKPVKDATGLLNRLKDEILPLLQEYCYEDYHISWQYSRAYSGGYREEVV